MLTVTLTPVIFYLLIRFAWPTAYCETLNSYDYDDLKIIGGVFKALLLFLLILGLGISGFFILKKFVQRFKNSSLQIIYIVLLFAILFYPAFRVSFQNYKDAELISGLCNKTIGDVLKVKSENVSSAEYRYLQHKLILLPDLPPQAELIRISYYHDGFLPDFSLQVLFRLPVNLFQKTDQKHWFEKQRDNSYKWIEYKDEES